MRQVPSVTAAVNVFHPIMMTLYEPDGEEREREYSKSFLILRERATHRFVKYPEIEVPRSSNLGVKWSSLAFCVRILYKSKSTRSIIYHERL